MGTQALEELQKIIARDYNKMISIDQAKQLGLSLLRLTNSGLIALARAEEKSSSVQARESEPLEVPGESV